MKHYLYILAILTTLSSCNYSDDQQRDGKVIDDYSNHQEKAQISQVNPLNDEYKFDLDDGRTLKLDVYAENNFLNIKVMQDSIVQQFDSLWVGDIEPDILYSDINYDGLNDLLINVGTDARGANELAHLFIQDQNHDFIYIKNSVEIPNIEFNETANAFTGIHFLGVGNNKTEFVDYDLLEDSLVATGGTVVTTNDIWTFRSNYKISAEGNTIIIGKDSIQDNGEGWNERN